jgi:hypothetical protein
MQHAHDQEKKKGHIVDPKEIDDKVATGPKKPSSGKTNRYSLKAGRKTVEIQVANLDNKRYELNMYIEGVELDEAKEFWAVIDKAKGGEVMAISSDEKGAKSSVKMSNFSKHDYHFGKDPRTLKIVKVAGSYKKGEKMIGTKLSFKEEVELTEALKPVDKSVIDAFYYKKERVAGNLLSTNGRSLEKHGMGGQTIAAWLKGKIAITAVSDVKSTESILKYMKKSIPKGMIDPKSYKKFFEDIDEKHGGFHWKPGMKLKGKKVKKLKDLRLYKCKSSGSITIATV